MSRASSFTELLSIGNGEVHRYTDQNIGELFSHVFLVHGGLSKPI
jgi:hypothetical protein